MAKKSQTTKRAVIAADEDDDTPADLHGQGNDLEPDQAPKPGPRVKVRAIRDGYSDHIYRRVGDVFTIDGTKREPLDLEKLKTLSAEVQKQRKADQGKPAAFSSKWMVLVDPKTPEHTSTTPEAMRRERSALVSGKPTGDASPLGDE